MKLTCPASAAAFAVRYCSKLLCHCYPKYEILWDDDYLANGPFKREIPNPILRSEHSCSNPRWSQSWAGSAEMIPISNAWTRHLWMKFKSYQPGIRHKSSWQTSSHISEKIWLSSFFIVSAVTSWIIITCSSKGKNSTLMKQEDLKMAELNQVTFPSLYFLQSSIKRRKGYDDVINDFAPRLLLHWCWSHRRCIAWNATCQTHFRNAKVTINPQNQVSVSFRKS